MRRNFLTRLIYALKQIKLCDETREVRNQCESLLGTNDQLEMNGREHHRSQPQAATSVLRHEFIELTSEVTLVGCASAANRAAAISNLNEQVKKSG